MDRSPLPVSFPRLRTALATGLLALLTAPVLQAQTVTATQSRAEVDPATGGLNQSKLFVQTPTGFSSGNTSNFTVVVDPSASYQTMDGFGASLTDSSAWLIWNKLAPSQRDWLMQLLFSPGNGIGLSLVRQPMGASDYNATGNYSYDDVTPGQTDSNLANFSLSRDLQYIVPLLQEARGYNSNLKIHALPWSPPGWMKDTGGSMNGGHIVTSNAQALANYFVKFVQAYQSYGLPVYAVSVQNEPEHQDSAYPSTEVNATDEGNFIGYYLGPAFANAGLSTRIFAYEHNWADVGIPNGSNSNTANPQYALTVLGNSAANKYVAGTAFHCYGGDPGAQGTLKKAYPAKDIWFTECTGSSPGDVTADLKWEASNLIVGTIRNWARGVTLWNVALDPSGSPMNGSHCNKNEAPYKTCRGLVTIDYSVNPATITANVEYYLLGQVAKFVVPGAVRIYSNTFGANNIEDVAFRNPDGSTVLFVLNGSSADQTFTTYWQGGSFNYLLPASAVVTFSWPAGTPSGTAVSSAYWYNVISKNSFSCVDGVTGGNGQPVQQWQCGNRQYNQEWQFVPTNSGYYKVVNRQTGLVWDVTGGAGATAEGTRIQQWSYSGGTNQQWQPVALGNGYYRFVARNSGKCLDTSTSTADGVQLAQYNCNGTPAQTFFLTQQP